jgi:hypothetical protein
MWGGLSNLESSVLHLTYLSISSQICLLLLSPFKYLCLEQSLGVQKKKSWGISKPQVIACHCIASFPGILGLSTSTNIILGAVGAATGATAAGAMGACREQEPGLQDLQQEPKEPQEPQELQKQQEPQEPQELQKQQETQETQETQELQKTQEPPSYEK